MRGESDGRRQKERRGEGEKGEKGEKGRRGGGDGGEERGGVLPQHAYS